MRDRLQSKAVAAGIALHEGRLAAALGHADAEVADDSIADNAINYNSRQGSVTLLSATIAFAAQQRRGDVPARIAPAD